MYLILHRKNEHILFGGKTTTNSLSIQDPTNHNQPGQNM